MAQLQQLVAATKSGTDKCDEQLAKRWRDNDPGSVAALSASPSQADVNAKWGALVTSRV